MRGRGKGQTYLLVLIFAMSYKSSRWDKKIEENMSVKCQRKNVIL